MDAPTPRYSASPPYSFASSVQPVRRVASFSEVFSEVWRWLRGKPRKVFPTDRLREQRLVDEIAAEIEAEERLRNITKTPAKIVERLAAELDLDSPEVSSTPESSTSLRGGRANP